jgi:hypothetical protein
MPFVLPSNGCLHRESGQENNGAVGLPSQRSREVSVVPSIGLSFVFGKHQCRAGMKGVCTSVMRLMCRAYSFRRCAAKHFPEADRILPDKGCYEGVVESVTQLTDSRRER